MIFFPEPFLETRSYIYTHDAMRAKIVAIFGRIKWPNSSKAWPQREHDRKSLANVWPELNLLILCTSGHLHHPKTWYKNTSDTFGYTKLILCTMTALFTTKSSGENQTNQKRSSKVFLCKICLSNYPVHKGLHLQECDCIFCQECLKQYLEHSVSEGNVLQIQCPDGACSQKGDITQLEISKILDDYKFDHYETLRKRKEVSVDKSKTFCPVPGCEGVCDGMPGMAQPSYCQDCGFTFCFECKEPWHSGKTCKEYMKNTTDTTSGLRFIDILKEGGTNDIKECPICQVLIQRDAGCAQMMCGNCKHMFCWHCRKSLDSDILLRHYDKGPCRNKLGHSRATLFLHRTQVIAGFIFFGAMILVASPFLLIISPCFLVSKCLFRRSEPSSL